MPGASHVQRGLQGSERRAVLKLWSLDERQPRGTLWERSFSGPLALLNPKLWGWAPTPVLTSPPGDSRTH